MPAALSGATAAEDKEFEITPEGADWTLLAYTVDDTITPVPFGVDVTMYLEGGDVSGNGGCNTFFGTYELDGSEISFDGEMGTTLTLCREPAQTVEDAFITLLVGVVSWGLEEGALEAVVADQSNQISKMRTRQKNLEEWMTVVEEELGLSAPLEEEPTEAPEE